MAQEEQTAQRAPILGPPSFAIMLGGAWAGAISSPAPTADGFMTRFQTTIPTAAKPLVLVAGLQWAPNGLDGNHQNQPLFFAGPVVLTPPELTKGWLLVGLDALWAFGAGLGPSDTSKPFGSDLVGEFVVIVPFGSKMMPTMISPFAGMSLVGLASQRITNLPRDPVTGDRDFFAPTLLAYLSIPLAPLSVP